MTDFDHVPPLTHPIDLQHLDGTLANLRRTERDVGIIVTFLTEARDRLAAAPADPETRHAVRMAELRMRGDATALAFQFQTMALPDRVTK